VKVRGRSLGLLFAGVLIVGLPIRRRRPNTGLAVLAVCIAIAMVGCGGGGSSSAGGGNNARPGTPLGTSPITITATTSDGVISHAVTFNLVVN
jgi:hypothetical protein